MTEVWMNPMGDLFLFNQSSGYWDVLQFNGWTFLPIGKIEHSELFKYFGCKCLGVL